MTRILGGDGSLWLRDFQEKDDMSFEHKPHNPNHGGVSRSGRANGFDHTDRHPSDHRLDWADWLLILAVFACLTAAVLGITIWADVPFEVAR